MQQNRYNEEITPGIIENLKTFLIEWYSDPLRNDDITFMPELFRHLSHVNISGNNISLIPKDFGTLPTLQKLDISNNNLGLYNDYSWSWLEQTAIKNSLLFLNLSGNLLTKLPIQVTKLNMLIILIISYNKLTYLPQSIKNIKHLNFLDVSDNDLLYFPASMSKMNIYYVNISRNLFLSEISYVNNLKMPRLIELSAKVIIKRRLKYDATVIPGTLIKYIDNANYCCNCGSACFDRHIREITDRFSYDIIAIRLFAMQQNIYDEGIILEIDEELKPYLIDCYSGFLPKNINFTRELFQHLQYVNISGNNISLIPKDFGTLPTLQKLDISNNNLGQYNDYNWSWLEQTAIKNSLLFLNLSGNLLTKLPIQVTKLNILITLIISCNKLTYLPQSIRNIKHLIFLDVSANDLLYLPAIMCKMNIFRIIILRNLFSSQTFSVNNLKMPRLTEMSAKVIINQRLEYDATVIPNILLKYIDMANYCCNCGSACFDSHIREITDRLHCTLMAFRTRVSLRQRIQYECYYCSPCCCNQYHSRCIYIQRLGYNIHYRIIP